MCSSKLGTYLAESLAGVATRKEKLDADAPAPAAGAPTEKPEDDDAGACAALAPAPAAPKKKCDAAVPDTKSVIVLL